MLATTRIVLSENEQSTRLKDALTSHAPAGSVLLAIGPEGGWTPDEEAFFRDAGWISASLGPTILRAETACVARARGRLFLLELAGIASRKSSASSAMLDPMAASKKPAPSVFIPDDKQREAIEHVHGPMLVIAGAGTGKTSVLVNRIASLIREGHARPDEILALTYTDNAAGEMRTRVKAAVKDQDVSKLQALTFHAYCNGLLHRTGNQFGVLDDKDLWIFLRRRIRELHLQHFVRAANVGLFLNDLLDFIRRCQDELVTPEQYQNYVDRICRKEMRLPRVAKSKDALPEEEALERCREIAGVFATAERWLAERNLGTFGHMITKAHDLLYHDAALLEEERRRFRFVLVDEFQDANYAQIRILSATRRAKRKTFSQSAIPTRRSTDSEARPAPRLRCSTACFPRPGSWFSVTTAALELQSLSVLSR